MNEEKNFQILVDYIKGLERVAVAFSGGADSALLAYAAKTALSDRAFAITIWSPLVSCNDKKIIKDFAEHHGIPLIRIPLDETQDCEFAKNSDERCYTCKSMRIKELERYAGEWRIPFILDGSNMDDLNDKRPGMKALKQSSCVKMPFLECGFTKQDIRDISRHLGLQTADKPASACLASRIPKDTKVEKDLLCVIDRAESFLLDFLPKHAQLRVRYDGKCAVIETESNYMQNLTQNTKLIENGLDNLGIYRFTVKEYKMGGNLTS